MDQYIGRLLDGRYEILEVIGTGGMAVVYKARCHRLNRLVAIKILKDEFSRDEEFRRRFRAEGEAVAMLSHPNIVQVYDVSSSDGADYIVMELIDGISLKEYMEKKGILNWKETLHFSLQMNCLFFVRSLQHFADGSNSLKYIADTILTKSMHAVLFRCCDHFLGRCIVCDQFAHFFIDLHDLEHTGSSKETGIVA